MARRFATYILLLGAFLLGACQRQTAEVQEQQFLAFGTLVDVTLHGVDATQAHQAFTTLERDLNQWHRDWHAWQPGLLTDLNRALATHGEAEVPATLRPLIEGAQRMSVRSGGLFNPAIGGLLALWGFQNDELPQQPPAASAIATWLKNPPHMTDLRLTGNHLTTQHRGVQLDFGACAKGYAAQRAIERLSELGVHNAIVAVAGDIHVAGAHGERPWRVGIRHPREAGILGAVELKDGESISTSGDYQRYFTYQGKRFHHLLDPRSGYPANTAISVTVIARDGLTADAAATALFIAGPEDWPRIARDLDVDQVMRVDNNGVVTMTPAMAARVRIEGTPTVQVQALP
ncbi:MAG: FAD:protein FMN transferase [Gammaproteobacteria bacterium]|nr:FAD:protein FMN transferase [Gammaproteobacteria bacterium]